MTRSRRAETAAGLGAIVALLAVVVGLPVLLYLLGGSPLPGHLSSVGNIGHDLLHRDSAAVVLGAVRDISWIAWAAFTLAVLNEIQAALRRRTPPRLFLGGFQDAAGRLVALAALTFSAAPVGTLLTTPQPVTAVATVPQADVTPLSHLAPQHARGEQAPSIQEDAFTARPGPQVKSMGFYQLVTVRPGDCLWTIAQQYLGNGDRYQEIVSLNLDHDMGHGQVFSDPSVIWPGWVLHLPAAGAGGHHRLADPHGHAPGGHLDSGGSSHGGTHAHTHAGHPTGHRPFSHPHHSASASGNGHAPTGTLTSPAPVTSPRTSPGPGASQQVGPTETSSDSTPLHSGQESPMPLLVAFGTGVLAGGAAMSLARLRHRQRQTRRRGRRIPLPVSAPVVQAEQRLNLTAEQQPVTSSLRGVLRDLGAGLVATGAQLPEITALRLEPDVLDILLASPAAEPPPPPFTVPGGYQGMTWRLHLDDELPGYQDEAGDLLPGLLTIGVADGGYLLADLEHLQVTQVDGPASLTESVLRSAAAELATGQLAGWYELILVGFPELAALGGRGTCSESLDAALDLLAAKAVSLRRRLGDAPAADVRYHRLTEPGDEDWALTLLVSAVPPTSGQLALLTDLAADPGGIAALVAGGSVAPPGHREPASIDLSGGPAGSDTCTASVWPLQLQARPQPLDEADYVALTSLFATATEDYDIAPDDAPYDSWTWPSDLPGPHDGPEADLTATALADPEPAAGEEPAGLEPDWAQAPDWAAGLVWDTDPDAEADPQWDTDPQWPADPEPAESAQSAQSAQSTRSAQPEAAPLHEALLSPPAVLSPPADLAQQADLAQPDAPAQQAGPASPDEPGETGDQAAALRIGVLGAFTINGQPGALLPAQSQLVLALALNGASGLSNQQLCYLLGADPDRPKPSDSLRQLIVRTRRQLGRAPDRREWIEHLGGGQYALHPEARFDWQEFDQLTTEGMRSRDAQKLRRALGLIRGRPFTGCYYWWLDLATTEAVRAQIVDAADVLAALEIAAGDPAAAARAARIGLTGDVAAEQLWRALMRAEHAAGNLSGVREAWNRCLDAISEIAPDGEPHPGTAALYRELLGGARPRPAWAG